MPRLQIIGMDGLGDTIYQRHFVRLSTLHFETWIYTPWPELYSDISVKLLRSRLPLRTQQKNAQRQPGQVWSQPPMARSRTIKPRYGKAELATSGIVRSLERQYPWTDGSYRIDLPNFGTCPVVTDKPIALVRPATLRREWMAPSRNPSPIYIQEAIEILRANDFYVVSIADVDAEQEWFDGEEPKWMHLRYHRGELPVTKLLALVQHSAVVVGGVGWIAPAAVAAKRPLFLIYGGRGSHNAPHVIFDSRIDISRVGWATPDPFCMCTEAAHGCNKTIPNFGRQFEQWLEKAGLVSRPRVGLLPSGSVELPV